MKTVELYSARVYVYDQPLVSTQDSVQETPNNREFPLFAFLFSFHFYSFIIHVRIKMPLQYAKIHCCATPQPKKSTFVVKSLRVFAQYKRDKQNELRCVRACTSVEVLPFGVLVAGRSSHREEKNGNLVTAPQDGPLGQYMPRINMWVSKHLRLFSKLLSYPMRK